MLFPTGLHASSSTFTLTPDRDVLLDIVCLYCFSNDRLWQNKKKNIETQRDYEHSVGKKVKEYHGDNENCTQICKKKKLLGNMKLLFRVRIFFQCVTTSSEPVTQRNKDVEFACRANVMTGWFACIGPIAVHGQHNVLCDYFAQIG